MNANDPVCCVISKLERECCALHPDNQAYTDNSSMETAYEPIACWVIGTMAGRDNKTQRIVTRKLE